jgi:SAM-dependent methyltransferase
MSKYDRLAPQWAASAYADPDYYLSRRAKAFLSVGPGLIAGDRVLELGCADGSFADRLLAAGLEYVGVDASAGMVEAATRRLEGRATVERGDLNDYRPAQPVAATCAFRSIRYVRDRRRFFHAVAGYTEKKLVFDVSPREFSIDEVHDELRSAGFDGFAMRPLLVPSSRTLPGFARRLLAVVEEVPPLARLLLAFRFSYICAAYRIGSTA